MVQLAARVVARAFGDRRPPLYQQPVCRVDISGISHFHGKQQHLEFATCGHLRHAAVDLRILPLPRPTLRLENRDGW
jgi:hypothetical protein